MAPQPGAEEDLQLGSGGGVAENKFQHNTFRGDPGPGTEGTAAQDTIEKLRGTRIQAGSSDIKLFDLMLSQAANSSKKRLSND